MDLVFNNIISDIRDNLGLNKTWNSNWNLEL